MFCQNFSKRRNNIDEFEVMHAIDAPQCEKTETIFDDRNDLKQIFRGDLYVIGKLWIAAMQSVLLGTKFEIIPSVHADKPKKPPLMKYEELPLYECPHYEYKNQPKDTENKEYKVRLLHNWLLPTVTSARQTVQSWCRTVKDYVTSTGEQAGKTIHETKTDFKNYMRDDKNLTLRQGVVALTTFTGFWLARLKGIPRKIFYTSFGALAGGSLCFPKETDEMFRKTVGTIGGAGHKAVRKFCGKGNANKELLCNSDLQEKLEKPVKSQCPKPKK